MRLAEGFVRVRRTSRGKSRLRVHSPRDPLAACVVVPGSAFFSCLSMSVAGLALGRDRLMSIGQAITMPLFFSSNALYPTRLMPGWLQAISKVKPLPYAVDALRGLLSGVPANLALDVTVLVASAVAGVIGSPALLPRLAR